MAAARARRISARRAAERLQATRRTTLKTSSHTRTGSHRLAPARLGTVLDLPQALQHRKVARQALLVPLQQALPNLRGAAVLGLYVEVLQHDRFEQRLQIVNVVACTYRASAGPVQRLCRLAWGGRVSL